MPRPPKWTAMVDYGLHSIKGDKENWDYDMKRNQNKEKLKTALESRIEDGLVVQVGNSFKFTTKGKRFYEETYESDEESKSDTHEREPKAKKKVRT
ncbi:hypothetical protein JCM11251_001716 [Rhodosporidiobolus azoricus]